MADDVNSYTKIDDADLEVLSALQTKFDLNESQVAAVNNVVNSVLAIKAMTSYYGDMDIVELGPGSIVMFNFSDKQYVFEFIDDGKALRPGSTKKFSVRKLLNNSTSTHVLYDPATPLEF